MADPQYKDIQIPGVGIIRFDGNLDDAEIQRQLQTAQIPGGRNFESVPGTYGRNFSSDTEYLKGALKGAKEGAAQGWEGWKKGANEAIPNMIKAGTNAVYGLAHPGDLIGNIADSAWNFAKRKYNDMTSIPFSTLEDPLEAPGALLEALTHGGANPKGFGEQMGQQSVQNLATAGLMKGAQAIPAGTNLGTAALGGAIGYARSGSPWTALEYALGAKGGKDILDKVLERMGPRGAQAAEAAGAAAESKPPIPNVKPLPNDWKPGGGGPDEPPPPGGPGGGWPIPPPDEPPPPGGGGGGQVHTPPSAASVVSDVAPGYKSLTHQELKDMVKDGYSPAIIRQADELAAAKSAPPPTQPPAQTPTNPPVVMGRVAAPPAEPALTPPTPVEAPAPKMPSGPPYPENMTPQTPLPEPVKKGAQPAMPMDQWQELKDRLKPQRSTPQSFSGVEVTTPDSITEHSFGERSLGAGQRRMPTLIDTPRGPMKPVPSHSPTGGGFEPREFAPGNSPDTPPEQFEMNEKKFADAQEDTGATAKTRAAIRAAMDAAAKKRKGK